MAMAVLPAIYLKINKNGAIVQANHTIRAASGYEDSLMKINPLHKGPDGGERHPYAGQTLTIRVPMEEKDPLMQDEPPP